MAGETQITVIGNVTADPETGRTQSGSEFVNFTIASTPRAFDRQANEWKDGETLFLRATAWRDQARHIAASINRGTRVICVGKLKQHSYKTKEGENRTSYEIEVDEIGPSLLFATASVDRARQGDPRTQARAQQPARQQDEWAPAGSGGYGDETPF